MLANSDLNHQQESQKNQASSQEKFWTPFDNIIPSLLLEEKGVKGNHIRLYGLIRSLSQKFGYCYASNSRLAATLECTERNIQSLLAWLEEKYFIERKEEGDEFNPERHIYLLDPRQKILTRGVKVAFTGGRRLPSPKEEKQSKNKKENLLKEVKETGANAPLAPDGAHPPPKIKFSYSKKEFENISTEKMELWKAAYPNLDIEKVFIKIKTYLLANPSKKKTKNWERFITKWLSGDEDKAKYQVELAKINGNSQEKPDKPSEEEREKVRKVYPAYVAFMERCRDPSILDSGFIQLDDKCLVYKRSFSDSHGQFAKMTLDSFVGLMNKNGLNEAQIKGILSWLKI